MFVWRWRRYDDKYKAESFGDKLVRTCSRCVGVILDNSSVQRWQTCQQLIQINLINQAVTICTASQANPAYRKIAVNQAQTCRID